MATSELPLDPGGLSRLVPLNGLRNEQLEDLVDEIELIEVGAGETFDLGPTSAGTIHHLVAGELELLSSGAVVAVLEAGTEDARLPLRHTKTQHDAVRPRGAPATLLQLDRARVSTLLILAGAPETGSAEWAARVMESELFTRVPPANVRRIFELMKAIDVPAGEIVIRQGDPGDFYYVVRDGRCEVTHEPGGDEESVRLAELGPGDGFGEEALVSDGRRNATVTMLTDGTLMRMTKDAFVELIHDPLLEIVDWRRAAELVGGGGVWLDVRLPDEYAANGLPGAANIPLGELRRRGDELERSRKYVLYCNSGRRSAAGAFLLSQQGIDAFVVADGLLGRTLTGAPEPDREDAPAGLEAQLLLVNAELEGALREKARADAERALVADEAATATGKPSAEFAERQARLEEVSRLANEAMHEAQRQKLALEAQMRAGEAEAEAQRRKAESEIERLRTEADARLRAEETRLQSQYAEAASQLKELDRSRREAEARFEEERTRLEAEHAREREALETEAERIRSAAEALKEKAKTEVERIRKEQIDQESALRGRLEKRLREERSRLESEFAMSLAQQDRARHDLIVAESAKRAAQREAQRLAAELATAEERRRADEDARRAAHLDRIEAEMTRADARIEEAQRERKHLESTIVRLRSDAPPVEDDREDTESRLKGELEEFEAKLAAADAEIDAASRAKTDAEAAQARAEQQLAQQDEMEERLRLQLHQEAETWVANERRNAEAELARFKEIEAGIERIQREKEQKRQAQASAEDDLMADILAQLGTDGGGGDDVIEQSRRARSVAEQKAQRAREAEAQAAAERERVQAALDEAHRKVELLRKRRGLD